MREIKFRAWDKEFKSWSDMPLDYSIRDINYYTDYEWLQYTGLKDKNGREIYLNSDYVKLKCWQGEGEEKEFYEDKGVISEDNFGNPHLNGFFFVNLAYIAKGYELEIIGNIYENPELLGDEE